jgi:ribosomal protein S14
MKYISIKDHKKRGAFLKKELNLNIVKAFSNDLRLPIKYRFFFFYELSAFYSRSSKTRISKRCILSSRSGSTISEFRVSRMFFRELANFGKLSGIYKASW